MYGPQWQSALARDLGVSDRTVRRWVAGATDMPSGLYVDLLRLTLERAAVLDGLAPRLRELAGHAATEAASKGNKRP